MNWYDRAEQEIEDELNNGDIDIKEYHRQMRDLRAEYEQGAQDAAQEAYDNY